MKLRRQRARHLMQFVPGQTFVECCTTNAALVTGVVIADGDLEMLDLASGENRNCSAHHCGPRVLEPLTALTIGLLAQHYVDVKKQATEAALTEEGYDLRPATILRIVAQHRETT